MRGTANSGVIGSPFPATSPTRTTASPSFVVTFAALKLTVTDFGRFAHAEADGAADADALHAEVEDDEATDGVEDADEVEEVEVTEMLGATLLLMSPDADVSARVAKELYVALREYEAPPGPEEVGFAIAVDVLESISLPGSTGVSYALVEISLPWADLVGSGIPS